jgi:hypothetical protein
LPLLHHLLVVVVARCCRDCALAVTTLPVFSVNSFIFVDIKGAIFMMAVDVVACMAIEYDNIHRVAYARN